MAIYLALTGQRLTVKDLREFVDRLETAGLSFSEVEFTHDENGWTLSVLWKGARKTNVPSVPVPEQKTAMRYARKGKQ